MKTKAMKLITAGLLLQTLSMAAFAGDKGGNGGGAHFCPGNEVEVEFYDLYEAREVWGKVIPTYAGKSVDEILDIALKKIELTQPGIARYIGDKTKQVRSIMTQKSNIRLSRVEDADILMTNRNCTYEQLANWHEQSNKIFIDQTLFNKLKLDNLGVAALILHEAAYKQARISEKVDNSNTVRKFVGEVFSTSAIETVLTDNLPTQYGLTKQILDAESDYYSLQGLFKDTKCNDGGEVHLTMTKDVEERRGQTETIVLINEVVPVKLNQSFVFMASARQRQTYSGKVNLRVDLKSKTCNESYSLSTIQEITAGYGWSLL